MITEALRWKFPAAKEQKQIEAFFQQSLPLLYVALRRINPRVPEVLCKNHYFSYTIQNRPHLFLISAFYTPCTPVFKQIVNIVSPLIVLTEN